MSTAVSARSSRGSRLPQATGLPALGIAVLLACSCRTVEPPLPPPEEPPREQVVSWQLTPAEGYHANDGFVTLEYRPPESLPDAPNLPRGGRFVVHLGYIDIRSANTLWYRFEVMEGAKRRRGFEGEDTIPNVKDPDQYWWNDLDIDLDEPVTGELRVIVTDKRIGAAYPFTLRKVITYR
jgi:hypothetical protein